MKKYFMNFFYWILIKSTENNYGDSFKESGVIYTRYF